MKKPWHASVLMIVIAIAVAFPSSPGRSGSDLVDETEGWEYIVNNATRTVMRYAGDKGAYQAVFVRPTASLIKQGAGEFAGKHLLKLVSTMGRNTSFAMMQPNFDVHANAKDLDDEREDLWKVVVFKFNGVKF